VIAVQSRPISGLGGYARPRSNGGLTTVWVGRSESGARVLLQASVVKKQILEGTK